MDLVALACYPALPGIIGIDPVALACYPVLPRVIGIELYLFDVSLRDGCCWGTVEPWGPGPVHTGRLRKGSLWPVKRG